jgi:hypothetical protein
MRVAQDDNLGGMYSFYTVLYVEIQAWNTLLLPCFNVKYIIYYKLPDYIEISLF